MVKPETRMLIDGELVEADSGATFDNVNPATEEVLGQVADASAADMQRAIAAARRAFDETDWSTDRDFRKHCLEQLQDGARGRAGGAARAADPRGRLPADAHQRPAARRAARDALRYPAELIDEFAWETDLPDARRHPGHRTHRRDLEGAGGRRRRDRALELPVRGHDQQARRRRSRRATPWCSSPPPTRRGTPRCLGRLIAEHTDIPAGVVNVVTSSDHLVGEELTLSPQVDLISFTGSTAVGKRIMEKGAATMKRLFLELGGKSATIVLDDADFDIALLGGHRRVLPRRPGLRHPDPDAAAPLPLRRGRRAAQATSWPWLPYGDPQRPRRDDGPADLRQAARPRARLHREGRRRRRHARPRRRPPGRTSTRVASSSRRCSSTSTTR